MNCNIREINRSTKREKIIKSFAWKTSDGWFIDKKYLIRLKNKLKEKCECKQAEHDAENIIMQEICKEGYEKKLLDQVAIREIEYLLTEKNT